MDSEEFEVEGALFRLKPLSVFEAEALAVCLTDAFTPAIGVVLSAKANSDLSNGMKNLARSVEQAPRFRAAFAKNCEYYRDGAGGWVPLSSKSFFEEAFQRKHLRYYSWLAKCIQLEFGDFLAEIGKSIQTAMKTASRLTSLDGSGGESGESPPTNE